MPSYSPAEILGGPVRVTNKHGDRLYYLTGQWEKRMSSGIRGNTTRSASAWMNIDLWALDAATAQLAFRKRVKRSRTRGDLAAMGVDQGVLWARIPELVGIRLADGVIVADSARIEARNPALAGLVPGPPEPGTYPPSSMQPLQFDPVAGLIVKLSDARQMQIDPHTLTARPYRPIASAQCPQVGEQACARMAVTVPENGMDWHALVRGLVIEQSEGTKSWLGLLDESELAAAQESGTISNPLHSSKPRRYRLYRAQVQSVESFSGLRLRFRDPLALAQGPEFLVAGLLTQASGTGSEAVVLLRHEPDSVFVLSHEEPAEARRLRLTRVELSAGRIVWSRVLPIEHMSAWFPGERYALLLGPDPLAARSPMAEEGENSAQQIIAIDLVSGALNSFNPDLHRDWPVGDSIR